MACLTCLLLPEELIWPQSWLLTRAVGLLLGQLRPSSIHLTICNVLGLLQGLLLALHVCILASRGPSVLPLRA